MITKFETKSDKPVLCFIPARGGSKGIIGKNMSQVGGESLISRVVQTSLSLSSSFSDLSVVVSSDDPEILQEATRCGAQIDVRDANISGDNSSTEEALAAYLGKMDANGKELYIAMLQCTSPFTRTRELEEGLSSIIDGGFDSAFIGVENHYWLYRQSSHVGSWEPDGHDLISRPSRQMVSPRAHETGAAYFFSKSKFEAKKFRIFGKTHLVAGDYFSSVDIDEQKDLDFARLVSGLFRNE